MNCTDFINILAIICSPVIAVFVGRFLQDREKNRNDKMEIFKILMGDEIEPRREFIEKNAKFVKNLDV